MKNTRADVIPDTFENYVLTEDDKKNLSYGVGVLLPESFNRTLGDGRIQKFELLVLPNEDTDMYQLMLGVLYEETEAYYEYLERTKDEVLPFA